MVARGARPQCAEAVDDVLLTGCSHAPHHVAREWADKYKGKFDQGWDRYREETLARQKKLGIVPPIPNCPRDRTCSPPGSRSATPRRNFTPGRWKSSPAIPRTPTGTSAGCSTPSRRWANATIPWSSSSGGQPRQHGRDAHRLVQRDDVLQRGRARRRPAACPDREVRRHRGIGRFPTAPHFAAAWAHANNTPFPWGKQTASHLGGTRNPMVIAWPKRIKGGGEVPHSSRTASTWFQPSSNSWVSPRRNW